MLCTLTVVLRCISVVPPSPVGVPSSVYAVSSFGNVSLLFPVHSDLSLTLQGALPCLEKPWNFYITEILTTLLYYLFFV